MDPMKEFFDQKRKNVEALGSDRDLRRLSAEWLGAVSKQRYSYHFTWLGVPIIQFPQDLMALQEIIWSVKPDAIVETGVAHGGSLIFHASMLELTGSNGIAIGVDVDIRPHNRKAIDLTLSVGGSGSYKAIRLKKGRFAKLSVCWSPREGPWLFWIVIILTLTFCPNLGCIKSLSRRGLIWSFSTRLSTICRRSFPAEEPGVRVGARRLRWANSCGRAINSLSTRSSIRSC